MPCKATQGRQVIVESSDKMWFTGGGNGKPLQYSCHQKPMNGIKAEQETHAFPMVQRRKEYQELIFEDDWAGNQMR